MNPGPYGFIFRKCKHRTFHCGSEAQFLALQERGWKGMSRGFGGRLFYLPTNCVAVSFAMVTRGTRNRRAFQGLHELTLLFVGPLITEEASREWEEEDEEKDN